MSEEGTWLEPVARLEAERRRQLQCLVLLIASTLSFVLLAVLICLVPRDMGFRVSSRDLAELVAWLAVATSVLLTGWLHMMWSLLSVAPRGDDLGNLIDFYHAHMARHNKRVLWSVAAAWSLAALGLLVWAFVFSMSLLWLSM